MTDEQILEALFAWLVAQTAGLFQTTNRRVKHWNDASVPQPALFMRHIGDTDEWRSANLSIRTLDCEVWIYTNTGKDPNVAADTSLTTLLASVRGALAPDEDGRFTLGGLVYWARIEGKSDYSPGDQGPQAIARIPLRVTLPV